MLTKLTEAGRISAWQLTMLQLNYDVKMYKKVPIFRCTTPSTGKRLKEFEVVVGTLYVIHYTFHCIMYQRRLQIPLISSLLMVLLTEISELFCTSFRLALVSKILLKTLSECESRIVGRSPNC